MTNDAAYGNRDIADLLPWYETGRLSADDRARVDAALATDPALRSELTLVREEMAETIAANELFGTPSRQAKDRFLAALEASPRGRARFSLTRFIADRLEILRPQTLALGAMAALALVVLQTGMISYLASGNRSTTTYQSASVQPESVSSGTILLVAFAPTATAGGIQKLLEDNGIVVVSGPAAGYYSLRVGSRDMPAPKVEEVIAHLSAHKDLVRSVMLQSPPD